MGTFTVCLIVDNGSCFDTTCTDITVTAPGANPISDDDVKPFAGLEALKSRLATDDGDV